MKYFDIIGSGNKPDIDRDNLRSKSVVRTVDLLSEGPIEGIVNPDTGAVLGASELGKGTYLNDQVITASSGSSNWTGITIRQRKGETYPTQTVIPGFKNTESETPGFTASQIKQSFGIVAGPSVGGDIDALRAIIKLNGLLDSQPDGDQRGTNVNFKFYTRSPSGSGSWIEYSAPVIRGKTTNVYQRDYRVDAPDGLTDADTWQMGIERLSNDNDNNSRYTDATFWSGLFNISDNRLTYPDSAVCGVELDAEQIGSQIPVRSYLIRGLKIKVPSNYFPENRTDGNPTAVYDGIWDGTFKVIWSDNPVWVLYDLLTNNRYGLGNDISSGNIDVATMYTISQYCDAVDSNGFFVGVDDGNGGLEPRFTFNGVINTRQEAYQIINTISAAFRGMTYWAAGAITMAQDSPADPIKIVGTSNVIDGMFNYSFTSLKARHTAVKVTWNDPNDSFHPKVEYVEDRDAIERFGTREKDVVAFGVTSQSMAYRYGNWILVTESTEGEMVDYTASFDHATVTPGQIIEINDPFYSGIQAVGRTVTGTTTSIDLDRGIDLEATGQYTLSFMRIDSHVDTDTVSASGNVYTFATVDPSASFNVGESVLVEGFLNAANNGDQIVTAVDATTMTVISSLVTEASVAGVTVTGEVAVIEPAQNVTNAQPANNISTLTVASPWTVAPTGNALWLLSGPNAGETPTKWRVLSNIEKEDNNFQITAVFHNENKYQEIEDGVVIEAPLYTNLDTRDIGPVTISNAAANVYEIDASAKHLNRWDSGDFEEDGYQIGDFVNVYGFVEAGNNGIFEITAVDPFYLEFGDATTLVNEGAGSNTVHIEEQLQIDIVNRVDGTGTTSVIVVQWGAPINGIPKSYRLDWRLDDGEIASTTVNSGDNSYEISPAKVGTYDVRVTALNIFDFESTAIATLKTVSYEDLYPPFEMQEIRLRDYPGTEYQGRDIEFEWDFVDPNASIYDIFVVETEQLSVNGTATTITRNDGGDWEVDGFGQDGKNTVQLFGFENVENNGVHGIKVASGATLWLFGTLVTEAISTQEKSVYLADAGSDSGINSAIFRDFKVEIKTGADTLIRTDYTRNQFYSYTFDANVEDNTIPLREIKIVVTPRDMLSRDGNTTNLTVTNPKPVPTNEDIQADINSYFVSHDGSSDPDWDGRTLIFQSETSGFTPSFQLEVKSQGSIRINSSSNASSYTVTIDGVNILDSIAVGLTGNPTQDAIDLVNSINDDNGGTVTNPNYIAEVDSGDNQNVIITADDTIGDTPNGWIVDVTLVDDFGGNSFTVVDMAGGIDPVFMMDSAGRKFEIKDGVESLTTYYVLIGLADAFFDEANGVSDLGFSPELTVRTLDPSLDVQGDKPSTPTGLTAVRVLTENEDGTVTTPSIKLTWNVNLATEKVATYMVYWERVDNAGAGSILDSGMISQEDDDPGTNTTLSASLDNAIIGDGTGSQPRYEFRIAARTELGLASNLSTPTINLTFDPTDYTAPGQPTNISTIASFKGIWLTFTSPANFDVNRIEVWASNTNDRATATLVGSKNVSQASLSEEYNFFHSALDTSDPLAPTVWYYWFRAIDNAGNAGNYAPNSSTTSYTDETIQTDSVDYKDLSITNAAIANLAVDSAKIDDLAVVNAKIGNLEVDHLKISGLGDPLGAAITTNKIALLAVTEATIDDLAVTSAKIDNLAVQNAKIGNLEVDSLKLSGVGDILGPAVETNKVKDNAITDGFFNQNSTNQAVGSSWTTLLTSNTYVADDDDIFFLCQGFIQSPVFGLSSWSSSFNITLEARIRLRNTTDSTDIVIFTDGVGRFQRANANGGAAHQLDIEYYNSMSPNFGTTNVISGKSYVMYVEAQYQIQSGSATGISWLSGLETAMLTSFKK